jgi:hypothetical protein
MMKTALLLVLAFLYATPYAQAQLLAGEVPDGASVVELNIELALAAPFSADTAEVEIDCDDFRDMLAVLIQGSPPVDAPNAAVLSAVDDDLEICADGTDYFNRPRYYNFGEPLVCSGGFDWQFDDEIVLGDYGGFVATGPIFVDSMYVAVRRGGQVGWMLISFRLLADATIQLHVHSALSLCFTTSVGSLEADPRISLRSTITLGEALIVEGDKDVTSLELLDPTGRVVAIYGASVRTIPAPDTPGNYLLRALHANGQRSMLRFVRQ